jgi:hypothetical protein
VLAELSAPLAARLRIGSGLLLDFAEPGPGGWRTELQWRADQSIAGRARLRYGMNLQPLTAGDGAESVPLASPTRRRRTWPGSRTCPAMTTSARSTC